MGVALGTIDVRELKTPSIRELHQEVMECGADLSRIKQAMHMLGDRGILASEDEDEKEAGNMALDQLEAMAKKCALAMPELIQRLWDAKEKRKGKEGPTQPAG